MNNMTAYDESFTYDAVGNRIGRVRLQSGQPAESTAYTHDVANRLLTETTGGVTKSSGSPSHAQPCPTSDRAFH